MRFLKALLLPLALVACATPAVELRRLSAEIDAFAAQAMAGTGAKGLAIAVIEGGQVRYVQAYGVRLLEAGWKQRTLTA